MLLFNEKLNAKVCGTPELHKVLKKSILAEVEPGVIFLGALRSPHNELWIKKLF
jgi:hypothetical protein